MTTAHTSSMGELADVLLAVESPPERKEGIFGEASGGDTTYYSCRLLLVSKKKEKKEGKKERTARQREVVGERG